MQHHIWPYCAVHVQFWVNETKTRQKQHQLWPCDRNKEKWSSCGASCKQSKSSKCCERSRGAGWMCCLSGRACCMLLIKFNWCMQVSHLTSSVIRYRTRTTHKRLEQEKVWQLQSQNYYYSWQLAKSKDFETWFARTSFFLPHEQRWPVQRPSLAVRLPEPAGLPTTKRESATTIVFDSTQILTAPFKSEEKY